MNLIVSTLEKEDSSSKKIINKLSKSMSDAEIVS